MSTENGEALSPLAMSDDDFLNTMAPAVEAPEKESQAEVPEVENTEQVPEKQPEQEEDDDEVDEVEQPEKPEVDEEDTGKEPVKPLVPDEQAKKPVTTPAEKTTPDTEPKEPAKEIDYKAEYERLMKPLKANGKLIDIRDPEELIKLAQQGANFTRKSQELAPFRKVLMMLQNNDLVDEGKLSYLIDLSRKDPEAIKKLVKEAGIDPMDIDTSAESSYKEGNHRVTDDEATFHSAVDSIRSTEEGRETLQVISTTWDQASKDLLFKNPEVMEAIAEARAAGTYDRIAGEVDRMRTLGQIPAHIPFLQAYKTVGDHMVKSGAFNDLVEKKPDVTQTPAAPVATRTAAPKSVDNNQRAKAAASTSATPKKAKTLINPLAMSDDDFMKQMENRL